MAILCCANEICVMAMDNHGKTLIMLENEIMDNADVRNALFRICSSCGDLCLSDGFDHDTCRCEKCMEAAIDTCQQCGKECSELETELCQECVEKYMK